MYFPAKIMEARSTGGNEAPELNDRFQTEDGLYWKVTGPDSVQLLEDQSKANSYAASYADLTGDVVIPATVEYSGKTFRVTSIGYHVPSY